MADRLKIRLRLGADSHAARRQRRLGQQHAERLRLERVTLGAARLDFELVEDRLRLRIAPFGLPLRAEPGVQLLEAVVGVEDAAHDELRRDRSVPVVLLQPERDVITAHATEAVELRALAECDRTTRVASVALHAEAQMLSVTDRCELAELATRRKQRDLGVREPEGRQLTKLLAEIERELRTARQHRIDDGRREQVVRREQAFCLRSEGVGEGLERDGVDREPGRCAMPAEALEVLRAGAEGAVQVEGRDRPARSFPETFAAGDQDDRPVVALDEPGSDDPDHAFVPVFAPDDIRRAPALRLGPFLDLRDRGANDALFDRLPVAVELFETIGEPARLVGILGQEELQGGPRMTEPPRRVDPRPEPEADLARVDGRGIDVRRLQQRPQSGLLRACKRAQPRDHE